MELGDDAQMSPWSLGYALFFSPSPKSFHRDRQALPGFLGGRSAALPRSLGTLSEEGCWQRLKPPLRADDGAFQSASLSAEWE